MNKHECVQAIRAARTEQEALQIMSDYLADVTYWAKEELAVARDDRANAVESFRNFKKDIRDYIDRMCG